MHLVWILVATLTLVHRTHGWPSFFNLFKKKDWATTVHDRYYSFVSNMNDAPCRSSTQVGLSRVLRGLGYQITTHGHGWDSSAGVRRGTAEGVSKLVLDFFDKKVERIDRLNQCEKLADRLVLLSSSIDDYARCQKSTNFECSNPFVESVYIALVLVGIDASVVAATARREPELVHPGVTSTVLASGEIVRKIFTERIPLGVHSSFDFVPFLVGLWTNGDRQVADLTVEALTAFRRHQTEPFYLPDTALVTLRTTFTAGGNNIHRTELINILKFLKAVGSRPWLASEYTPLVTAMGFVKNAPAVASEDSHITPAEKAILDLPGSVFVGLVRQGLVRPRTRSEEKARQNAIYRAPVGGESRHLTGDTLVAGAGREYLPERIEALGKYVLGVVSAFMRYQGSLTEAGRDRLSLWRSRVVDLLVDIGDDKMGTVLPHLKDWTKRLTLPSAAAGKRGN